MFKLHENYYLRKQCLAKNEVPTQSVMKSKMGKPLSKLYFKDMSSRLKILAGLEPTLGLGCGDWYMPPKDTLKGRSVLKPVKKTCLSKLKYTGIEELGKHILHSCANEDELEKKHTIDEMDRYWKEFVIEKTEDHRDVVALENLNINTSKLKEMVIEFNSIYIQSLTKIENILLRATEGTVERIRKQVFDNMKETYEKALQKQSTELTNKYEDILFRTQEKLKNEFMGNISTNRKKTMEMAHDINVEKYRAVEKLKIYLECQNLACQVYVAATEKDESNRKLDEMKIEHRSRLEDLKITIKDTDEQIFMAKQKEKEQKDHKKIWQQKACLVVKRLQLFIKYCLNLIPEHNEFFINMESLMLLQLNESQKSPETMSILLHDVERPRNECHSKIVEPVTVLGDMKKHSHDLTTDMPMFAVNKNCIYAVCENIKDLTDKLHTLIQENKTIEAKDDYDYSQSLPVKYTSDNEAQELKLESSLMKIIQNEILHVENMFNTCNNCKSKICLCSPPRSTVNTSKEHISALKTKTPSTKAISKTKITCKCQESAKKKLIECLPPYMLKTSKYHQSLIDINYEPCPELYLQRLAKSRLVKEEKSKDIGTQYAKEDVDILIYACSCIDDENVKMCQQAAGVLDMEKIDSIHGQISDTYLSKSPRTFARERALDLKKLIGHSESLKEIFRRKDCNF